ncbi:hypothetical protein J7K03_00380 [bacterium]|nr:hypothetical protein [bacterium]
MDDMTRIELLENLENEWRELETAFRTLESTLKEIQKGKNILVCDFLADTRNLLEAVEDFYNKISLILNPSFK